VGETVERACIREAFEETNINVKILNLIGVFSDPKRDPRGHNISIAFKCVPVSENEKPLAKDDAKTLEIIPLDKILDLKLAFDHLDIIKASGIL